MTDNGTNMYMPVAPAYGGGYGGMGGGLFGADGWWIILLLLICGGGWGNGFGFGGGNGMFPWMMAGQTNGNNDVQRGFDHAAIMDGLTGITGAVTSGFGDVQLGIAGINQNLCQTGNSIVNAVNSGFNGAEIAANGRAMANMQQLFGVQSAIQGGASGTQMGLADLKYTVATENCADRTAALNNTRDIIESQTRGTQAILDKLCALELDGIKGQLAAAQRENVGLQNQLNMAALRESQTAQNAFIAQGFSNEVDALYNRLNTCPVPSTPVYGRTPIFTCGGTGCGCGCGMAA